MKPKKKFFFSISKLKLSRFRLENFEKLTLCIACAHSLASQCMEGHWMWDYQMCEAEILQGSGKGHTHAYSHQLVPKNSNFRPRIFLVLTLWTVNFLINNDEMSFRKNVTRFELKLFTSKQSNTGKVTICADYLSFQHNY